VTGIAGQDSLVIQSHGDLAGYQGLIIDSISLTEWVTGPAVKVAEASPSAALDPDPLLK